MLQGTGNWDKHWSLYRISEVLKKASGKVNLYSQQNQEGKARVIFKRL